MERVTFTTYDDVELVGNLYLPARQEGDDWSPGIIVCPGFGSTKEKHAAFGELASAEGFATLIIDLRGHGESGGELDANVFNDVAAALLCMQNRAEINPMNISIRGSSMGGWLAIHTAAHLADLSPVVAYCPTSEAILSLLLEEVSLVQHGHTSPLVQGPPPQVNVNSMMQLVYRVDVSRAARRISPRPLLLVHCEGDEVVPDHVSQKIYDTALEPKSFWLLPGGDHNFAQHDPATSRRVLGWLRQSHQASGRLSGSE